MYPRLLIVDDDEAIARQLRWALADEFDIKVSTGNKEEVLTLLSEFSPDVITLDINLSGSSEGNEGLGLLPEILKANSFVKVVMITANDTKDNALTAIKNGAFDFYVKPIDTQEISIILKRAVHLKRLEEELYLSSRTGDISFAGIVGKSGPMLEVFSMIQAVAPNDFTVLVTGESGTGKELVARAIHSMSPRRERPFVVVNCGAIPENLLESELFGYKKGAFTGAVTDKKGRFELADRGTLFLDEVGELPLHLQVKLLRVLQEKVIQPIGSNRDIPLDIRIIAATNSDLKAKVGAGDFREDLYYRLNVINIKLPPLRARGDDIVLLAQYFVDRFSSQIGKKISGLTDAAIKRLVSYPWPGNVRQLENTILRAVILTQSQFIDADTIIFEGISARPELSLSLPDSLKQAKEMVERMLVERALKKADNNISKAAKILEISRPQLYQLMARYGMKETQA